MKKLLALAIPAAFFLASCSSAATTTNLQAGDFGAKSQEPGVVTLDVRTAGEFMAGHIKGAINIDVEGTQFASEISKLDKTVTYTVYCKSGRRSAIAAEIMVNAGFKSLFNLENGIQAWLAAGLPQVQQ